MGEVKKRPDKKVKAKQMFIEGMAPIRIAAIDAKAEALIELKHERSRLTDDNVSVDFMFQNEINQRFLRRIDVVEVDGTHYRFELPKETPKEGQDQG